jgi:hypothetical protein
VSPWISPCRGPPQACTTRFSKRGERLCGSEGAALSARGVPLVQPRLPHVSSLRSEFLAAEDRIQGSSGPESLFWRFADSFHDRFRSVPPGESADAVAERVVQVASKLVQPLTLQVLSVSVAARAHAAAIEMQRELAATSSDACSGDAWAVILPGSATACTAAELTAALERPGSTTGIEITSILEDDHALFPGRPVQIVLHGVMGTGAFHSLYHAARDTDAAGLVVRHFVPVPASAGDLPLRSRLSGWGAGLDVKNTEYKVMDDRASTSDAQVSVEQWFSDPSSSLPNDQAVAEVILRHVGWTPSSSDSVVKTLGRLFQDYERWRASDATIPERTSILPNRINATAIGVKTASYILQASGRIEAAVEFETTRTTSISEARGRMIHEALNSKRAAEVARAAERGETVDPESIQLSRAEQLRLAQAPVPDMESEQQANDRFDQLWLGANAPERQDPLALLTHLTGNFPAAAPALSHAPVEPQVLAAIQRNTYFVSPGQNIVLVNGRVVDVTALSFNFFSVLHTLQQEASILSQFASLPLSDATVQALREVGAGATSSTSDQQGAVPEEEETHPVAVAEQGTSIVRVDYRSGLDDAAAVLISDVEKDQQYRRFPQSLRALLAPTWQLHQVRRNLYNVLLFGDLSSPGALRATLMAAYFAQQGVPVSFSFVPLVSAADASDKELMVCAASKRKSPARSSLDEDDDSAVNSLDVALLLGAARRKHGAAAARSVLLSIANEWQAGLQAAARAAQRAGREVDNNDLNAVVARAAAIEAYSTGVQAAGGGSGLFPGGALKEEAAKALKDTRGKGRAAVWAVRKWHRSHGLPSPGFLFNGRPGSGLAIQETVFPMFDSERQILVSLVQQGALNDKDKREVLPVLLSAPSAVPVYHQAALDTTTRPFLAMGAPEASPLLWSVPRMSSTVDVTKPVTADLFEDMDTDVGLQSVRAALSLLQSSDSRAADQARIGLVHTGEESFFSGSVWRRSQLLMMWAWLVNDEQSLAPVRTEDRLPAMIAFVDWLLSEASPDLGTAPIQSIHGSARKRFESLIESMGSVKSVQRNAAKLGGPTLESSATRGPRPASPSQEVAQALFQADKARMSARLLMDRLTPGGSVEAGSIPIPTSSGAFRAVATNGRVVALGPTELLTVEVLSAAVGAEARARGSKVLKIIESAQILSVVDSDDSSSSSYQQGSTWRVEADDMNADFVGTLAATASSIVGLYAGDGIRRKLPEAHLAPRFSSFVTAPKGRGPSGVQVDALLDPVSEAAQRAAPLLQLMRDALGAQVRVFLHPNPSIQASGDDADFRLPLKSFYRFAGPGIAEGSSNRAVFPNLPSHLLTAKVYPPEPWDVQTEHSPVDADNIVLALGDDVQIGYGLKSILVAGQCEDLSASAPPNGLQLQLGPAPGLPATRQMGGKVVLPSSVEAAQPMSDTLVMQNLGYFQLKSLPGVRAVTLAPGRASQLYEIVTPKGARATAGGLKMGVGNANRMRFEGESAGDGQQDLEVVPFLRVTVRDFTGPITQLQVRKREGQEQAKLLLSDEEEAALSQGESAEEEERADPPSLWDNIRSMLGGRKAPRAKPKADNRIHVFSLASGHLYERFLKIMMLSVVKRSSRPVKFWLVENFLSPQFKETVQTLAKNHGFEVQTVTYKWPNWLRAQTEKQRIIWGYKILFLDVLFPLDVDKVIYVDADQVVRADMAELWDMDLEGAPYAYTPFCDSRKETLGYQFWRQGYWKDHLGGKPYHISALYVVDLKRFRRMAVGDRLRAVYDQLSRDPNSLSNLDQDLPNYVQSIVPIKSLPQPWLWCESWCSDATKAEAKTIDLCNNPMHKEPKLEMARRVISGPLFQESWVQLDEEVARTDKEVWNATSVDSAAGNDEL